MKTGGTLTVPSGSSGYDTWMQNATYYLGMYNWNLYVETRVVAKFNVTDTSNPTSIIGEYVDYSLFSAIEIDGVEQPSVVSAYTFSTTGEHTVKYTLTDPTSISDYAFNRCSSLTSIEIPSGITSIGDYAFSDCSGLTSVDIPSGVTSIGDWAFEYCYSLTNIDILDSVTTIGQEAFCNCDIIYDNYELRRKILDMQPYAFECD